jgi:hypothetical protein
MATGLFVALVSSSDVACLHLRPRRCSISYNMMRVVVDISVKNWVDWLPALQTDLVMWTLARVPLGKTSNGRTFHWAESARRSRLASVVFPKIDEAS